MTNHTVSNRADLRERTKTMSRHGDRRGQIADFRHSFETINWLYLLFKCGIKTKAHFEWLLWHWSSLGQLNLEPTRPNGLVGCKVPTDLVKISVKEATHMGFHYRIWLCCRGHSNVWQISHVARNCLCSTSYDMRCYCCFWFEKETFLHLCNAQISSGTGFQNKPSITTKSLEIRTRAIAYILMIRRSKELEIRRYDVGCYFLDGTWYCCEHYMMTSSNGNIFRVTGHLCGEFTGSRWIPRTKASEAELWYFLWSASE